MFRFCFYRCPGVQCFRHTGAGRYPVHKKIPTRGRDTNSWPFRRTYFRFGESRPSQRAGCSRPQGLRPWGFPAMLARNGPVGNSGYAACGVAPGAIRRRRGHAVAAERFLHSSLFPRCVLRFSARTNGTPGEGIGAGHARGLLDWIPACAGMTGFCGSGRPDRESYFGCPFLAVQAKGEWGAPASCRLHPAVIPAIAGIQYKQCIPTGSGFCFQLDPGSLCVRDDDGG